MLYRFQVPYNNITSIEEALTPKLKTKRIGRQLDFNIPFAKRLKGIDPRMMVEIQVNNDMRQKDICLEIAEARKGAAEAQDVLIQNKLRMGVTSAPCKGNYYLCKQKRHLQRKWRDVVKGNIPGSYTRSEVCIILTLSLITLY